MEMDDLYTVPRHDAGAEMRVKDEYGKDTNFYIKLVGVDSAKWAKIRRDNESDLLKMGKGEQVDEVKIRVTMISEAIMGWRGLSHKKKMIKFSKAKAKELLRNAPHVAIQADGFLAKRVNFTKG